MLTAAVMLLLPTIYIGLTILVGWLFLYFLPLQLIADEGRSVTKMYAATLLVGPILLFFLLKPLLARRSQYTEPQALDPKKEPLLFAFVHRLCEVTGAPVPTQIFVDINVNAAARIGTTLRAFIRRDMQLIIGLPLVADFSLRQLAGVLSHELGHFSQGSSMRLTYIVNRINTWFSRVVYGRDKWDDRLDRWSKSTDMRYVFVLQIARGLIWGTRRFLWLLMMTGYRVSRYTMRQMEFDADRYEAEVAGSDVFETTTRRMRILSVADSLAHNDLANMWSEGRLVNDLPGLVIASVDQLDAEVLKAIDEQYAKEETGKFDTHPSSRERVALVEANPTPGIFTDERPARELFSNFKAISRTTTLEFYRQFLGESIEQAHLIEVSKLIRGKKAHGAQNAAAVSFFGGSLAWPRSLGMTNVSVTPTDDRESLARALTALRQRMEKSRHEYEAGCERLNNARYRLASAVAATRALSAKLRLPPEFLHTNDIKKSGAKRFVVQAKAELAEVEAVFTRYEKVSMQRFSTALASFKCPEIVAHMEEEETLRRRLAQLMPIARAVEKSIPQLATLEIQLMQLQFVASLASYVDEGTGKKQNVLPLLMEQLPPMMQQMHVLFETLKRVPYPYEHAEGVRTVARYALPTVPEHHDIGKVSDAASQILERMSTFYFRLLAGLAQIAIRAEVAAGLPEPKSREKEKSSDARTTEPQQSETMNNEVVASDPGGVVLSLDKLRVLDPELFPENDIPGLIFKVRNRKGLKFWRLHIKEHLLYGDSRAAMVASVKPLRVAAFSGEFDCVVLLEYPNSFVVKYGLKPGMKLLTVNTYEYMTPAGVASDITLGPRAYGRWANYSPLIAEFLSDDMKRINQRKREIDNEEWKRCAKLTQEYLNRHGYKARSCHPRAVNTPAF